MKWLTAAVFLMSVSAASATGIGEIAKTMPPGTWRELEDTRIVDVAPSRSDHSAPGLMGPKGVVMWGSCALDDEHAVLACMGGGHKSYGGNEVYEFDLETLEWVRATEPSAYEGGGALERDKIYVTVDDTPTSAHQYDGVEYAPNADRIIRWGGAFFGTGGWLTDKHAWRYDVTEDRWERGAGLSKDTGYNIVTNSVYDPETGLVYYDHADGLAAYDPVADRWTIVSDHVGGDMYKSTALDPKRRIIVGAGETVAWRGLDGGRWQEVRITGASIPDTWSYHAPGIEYHPSTDRMLIWGGDRDVYALDTETWRLTRLRPAGNAPVFHDRRGRRKSFGVWGRWRYVPDHDVFIAVPGFYDNVWLYKPPPRGWSAPAPAECGHDLCVGPDYRYGKPSDAALEAREGDTVWIQPGRYRDSAIFDVTVSIMGNGATLQAVGENGLVLQGKGKAEVSGLEIHGAAEECILVKGGEVTFRDIYLHDCEMGLRVNRTAVGIHIFDSRLEGMIRGDEKPHYIYCGQKTAICEVENSLLVAGPRAIEGHLLKSASYTTRFVANRLIDRVNTEAALMDIWGCGVSYVGGNSMTKTGVRGGLKAIDLVSRHDYGKLVPCDREGPHIVKIIHNTLVWEGDHAWSHLYKDMFGVDRLTAQNNLVVNTKFIEKDSAGAGANIHYSQPAPGLFADDDYRLSQAVPAPLVADEPPGIEYGGHERSNFDDAGAFAFRVPETADPVSTP